MFRFEYLRIASAKGTVKNGEAYKGALSTISATPALQMGLIATDDTGSSTRYCSWNLRYNVYQKPMSCMFSNRYVLYSLQYGNG